MGGKHIGPGKHVHLCIACLILFSLIGCNALKEQKREIPKKETKKTLSLEEASERLTLAKQLLEQGKFDASMEQNEKALSLYPKVPIADEAIFNMALIYAHYNNPKKDYRRSISFLEKLVKEYRTSPFALQSRIWRGVLEVIEKSKDVDMRIEEMKKELSR